MAAVFLCVLMLAACRAAPGSDEPAVGPNEGVNHPMVGQVAPDFLGEVPGGGWVRLRVLRGKPVALVIFRPRAPYSRELVEALGALRDQPGLTETGFVGVAVDSAESVERFAKATGGALPMLRDPGPIASDYRAGDGAVVVLIDAQGFVRFRMDGFAGPRFRDRLEALTQALRRAPVTDKAAAREIHLEYTRDPRAPVFTGKDLDGKVVSLTALRGQVVVLHFFDQECPQCLLDLPRLVPVLREMRPSGVRAIGVASRDDGGGLRRFLKENGIDYPVVIDADRSLFHRFESTRTPDLFVIDPAGFIRFREQGDRPDRADLLRLQIRLALGRETPSALAADLPRGRFLGDGTCAACHDRERRDWLSTPHSIAWDSLSKGDKWKDAECVPCHVTGAGQPGGFTDPETTPHLTQVQCEVCHGMGGGHPDGGRLDPDGLSSVCATCHSGKFVLNFSLEEALPLVAHRGDPDLDRLFKYSEAQRQRLEQINKRRLEKFKSGVTHVGAEACRGCHAKEYEQWSRTPHAAAFAPLLNAGRGGDKACTPCHTTGFGLQGGFGAAVTSAMLGGVQCEVCHGPGEDHVGAPADLKKETIYGITDQCSFCIIQGVCATCHDASNDPDFDFEPALAKVTH